MSGSSDKKQLGVADLDAFEMIELAIDEVELLARAFNLISEVCCEMDCPTPSVEDGTADIIIN